MENHLHKNNQNYFSRLSISLDKKQNDNWIKDCIEQTSNFKNNTGVLKLEESDAEGFLKYVDRVGGKYV